MRSQDTLQSPCPALPYPKPDVCFCAFEASVLPHHHVAPPTSRLTHSFLTCNTPTFPQGGPNHLLPPFLFCRTYCPYLLLSVEVGFLCEGVFTLEPHGLPCPAATTLCIGADSRRGGFQGRRSPSPGLGRIVGICTSTRVLVTEGEMGVWRGLSQRSTGHLILGGARDIQVRQDWRTPL